MMRVSTSKLVALKRLMHAPVAAWVALGIGLAFVGCSDAQTRPSGMHDDVIRIVATDGGFELPTSVPAGLSHVVFENLGSTIHEAMFIRLPDEMAGEDYLEAVRGGTSFPEGALDYSGPGLTSPGEIVEVWLHLDPGTYLVGCWFRGHLTAMPVHTLTVHETAESGATSPPSADATLRMIDYRFELDGSLRPGPRVVRIETPGPSLHEVDFFRLGEGKTLEDLRSWQKGGKKGPAPAVAIGGILDYHDVSRVVWLKTRFEPGEHVLWCGIPLNPDDADAVDITHADAGMYATFVVED